MQEDGASNESHKVERDGFPDEYLELTGDDLLKFFGQFDPELQCPMCKSDMGIMAAVKPDDEGHPGEYLNSPALVGMPAHEIPEKSLIFKTPAIPMKCEACGFLSFFSADVILKWKKKHGHSEQG